MGLTRHANSRMIHLMRSSNDLSAPRVGRKTLACGEYGINSSCLGLQELQQAPFSSGARANTAALIDSTVRFITEHVREAEASGVALGVSGGLDSTVLAFLACISVGRDRVHALHMPDATSERHYYKLVRKIIELLEIRLVERDISRHLRDGDMGRSGLMRLSRLPPRLGRLLLRPLVSVGMMAGYSPYEIVLRSRSGFRTRTGAALYRHTLAGVESSFCERHIARRVELEEYAERFSLLPLGSANRTERLVGWFVEGGIDDMPCQPLMGLYKSEVRLVATSLRVPAEILAVSPSPDMLLGIRDELALGVPYRLLDAALQHLEQGTTDQFRRIGGKHEQVMNRVLRLHAMTASKRSSPAVFPDMHRGAVSQ